jgi:phosphate transport system permease protein
VATSTTEPGPTLLQGSSKRRHKERAIRLVLQAASAFSLAISIAIVFTMLSRAVDWLTRVELSGLWGEGWFPRADTFDIVTLVAGTLIIAVIAIAVAAPLGLGAALYLSEYATPRARRRLKPVIEVLAGIPSVVLGYFALTVITPGVVDRVFSTAGTFNFLSAGIAVGILTIPLVASVTEDALYAVPRSLREAAYGIGARRSTVAMRVVFPAGISGVMAALILAMSRAIGETMVVAIAAGATGGALRTFNPLEGGQTMTGAISSLAIGTDRVRGSDLAFGSLYFVGVLLFAITLVLNVFSERLVRRYRKEY